MSLKLVYPSKWNVSQNGMSLKIECPKKKTLFLDGFPHTNWNVTEIGMSLKFESH